LSFILIVQINFYFCVRNKIVMKKNKMIQLKFIRERMKNKPTLYKLYNHFMGVENSLTKEELMEIKSIVKKESDKFISELDKSIKKAPLASQA